MDQQTKMQKVVEVMREKGATDEKISAFLTELTKASFARFYTTGMAVFTEEDMQAIEACQSEEESHRKIKELYALRTGQDAEQATQKFLDDFAQGFLAEYEKEKAQATAA